MGRENIQISNAKNRQTKTKIVQTQIETKNRLENESHSIFQAAYK